MTKNLEGERANPQPLITAETPDLLTLRIERARRLRNSFEAFLRRSASAESTIRALWTQQCRREMHYETVFRVGMTGTTSQICQSNLPQTVARSPKSESRQPRSAQRRPHEATPKSQIASASSIIEFQMRNAIPGHPSLAPACQRSSLCLIVQRLSVRNAGIGSPWG